MDNVSDSLSDINKKLNPMSILSKQSLGRTTQINSQQSTVRDVISQVRGELASQKSVAFQRRETNNDEESDETVVVDNIIKILGENKKKMPTVSSEVLIRL